MLTFIYPGFDCGSSGEYVQLALPSHTYTIPAKPSLSSLKGPPIDVPYGPVVPGLPSTTNLEVQGTPFGKLLLSESVPTSMSVSSRWASGI